MLSDIEIAQNAEMNHIKMVAESVGISEEELEYNKRSKSAKLRIFERKSEE